MTRRSSVPLVLGTVLSLGVLVLAWRKLGEWHGPALIMGIGALAFGGGVLLRVAAVRALGAFYSHRVRVRDAHLVVSTGPFRWLRHPAYSGMLAAHLGFVLVFFNEVSLFLLVAALLPAVVARIRVEERALQTVPGYAEFCRDRARLVPFVW